MRTIGSPCHPSGLDEGQATKGYGDTTEENAYKICYGCGDAVTRESVERFTHADLCPACFESTKR